MKRICYLPLLIFILAIMGCQTGKAVQFVVPQTRQHELLDAIQFISNKHGLANKLGEEKIKNAIAYFQEGEPGSWLVLGARTHADAIVVDLSIYEAGIYDKKRFQVIEEDVYARLTELYGEKVRIIRELQELIPVERKGS